MKLLVTGGAGFIGSAFVRYAIANQFADETFPLKTSSPYAASKAGSDLLALS